MSRENSELNSIENLFEYKLEMIQEFLGVDEIDGHLEEMIWAAAEKEFDSRGVAEGYSYSIAIRQTMNFKDLERATSFYLNPVV